MSNLTYNEKQILESLLGMEGGIVLNFSNNSMALFFKDELGINIYDPKYLLGSESKANYMRGYWQIEDDNSVGVLIFRLIEYVKNQILLGKLNKNSFPDNLIFASEKIASKLTGMTHQKAEIKLKATFSDGNISIILQKDVFNHVQTLLDGGYYFNAVEEAYKIVRKKLKNVTGKEKATEGFNEANQVKIFGHLPVDEVEKDFFEGVKFLHMAVQFLRNEKAHVPAYEIDHNLALHYIALASLAYDLIDKKSS